MDRTKRSQKAVKQMLAVIRYDFRGFFKRPRVILTFLLGFVLCFLLSSRIMPVMDTYQSPVQMLEPFLWTFGDSTAILLSSVLLLLLFSDLPVWSAVTPYYLYRTTKIRWILGQMIYMALAAGLYTLFMMGSTMILCASNSYPGNIWSDTAAMLAYSRLGEILCVPSTVKVMESISPFGCAALVILLLFLYILCLGSVILAGNLLPGKNRGTVTGLTFCLYGFLLDPKVLARILGYEKYELFRVNVLIGWLSPLSHASYGRHNFGYDRLPSIGQSVLVFLGILALLTLFCIKRLKTYSFVFLGEKD